MHLENRFTSTHVRKIDSNLPVETTRPQQRWIQHIGPVRRSDNNNPLLGIKTVHFHQECIQRLLAFIVPAAQAMATAAADRINFVDKDQARSVLTRLLE